jgi:hypothetical protein
MGTGGLAYDNPLIGALNVAVWTSDPNQLVK